VREPFVELLKSSMKTFLNAMTYPDKTIYPVSSRNTADFMNLTSVYLDAVFAPAILKDKNIFYQEGHHIELDGDTPSYKGVVFNEMKGAMSGVDDNIEIGINSLLFPNNCYRFNSGGAPEEIPDLTYEQFIETYKKHYHPSNARIYLDGDIPLAETLTLIDSYLSRFDAAPVSLDIEPSVSARVERTDYFEVAEGEETEGEETEVKSKFASIVSAIYDYAEIFAISIVAVIFLFSFGIRLCRVDGSSMNQTLKNDEPLIAANFFYTPKQGDIVVFHLVNDSYHEPLVKRVIALEGQTVEIDMTNNQITVDGKVYADEHAYLSGGAYEMRYEFDKQYIFKDGERTVFRATVPEGKIFVLGDNRNGSSDSRSVRVGFVDKRSVLGRAVLRLSPFAILD
jgi:signal peptidase I